MAHINANGLGDLEGFIQDLSELGENIDEIAKECIDEAAPTLENMLKNNIASAANRGYATGTLAQSIEPTEAKKNAYGVFAAVRPTGTDKKGLRNAEKMAYLEYGTSKQEAHPVIRKTVAEAEPQVTETIRKRFEEHVAKCVK